MNLNTVQDFRHEVYGCFPRAADALFNTVDALLTETHAHTFAELSLSPFFERRWGSLYEAFEDGRIDQTRLRGVFAKYLLRPVKGEQMWLGIDATSIERPQSKTASDRTVVYKPNLPESSKPISYGWQFSTVVLLPEQPSSWTAVLDQQRIRSDQTSVEVAATQLRQLAPLLGSRPIVATDRWYSCAPFLLATEGLPFDKLLRLKRKRVLYRAAPAPTGKRGAPRKDGERFQCGDPSTYGEADGRWQGTDAQGHPVEITWWTGLHLPKARHLEVTVIRVLRYRATDQPRDPRESWFLWDGGSRASVCQKWPWATDDAIRTSMAIASTSKACCGHSPGCVPQRNLNAGARSSPLCIITWCWRVHWSQPVCVPGRAASGILRHNRCAGRWRKLWRSWERLLSLPNHAENRQGDTKGRS
jgi:hypothetical protein